MSQRTIALAVVGILIIACVGIGAYMAMDGNDDEKDGIEVTDLRGRVVTIPDDIDKIVCLSAGSVRLAAYLDATDMIVGVDDFDKGLKGPSPDTPRWSHATYRLAFDTTEVTCVGSESNYKAIMETGAQLIITSKVDVGEIDQIQKNTGIPTIGIIAEGQVNVDDKEFRDNINLLGKALGKEQRAKQLLDGIDSMVNELEGYASKTDNDKKAYIGGMFYMMEGDFYKTSGNYIPFDLAGIKNTMPAMDGNPYNTDAKSIAEAGADYIFVDSINGYSSKPLFDKNKDVFSDLGAVKDGNIYSTFSYKFYGTNWESELMNAYYIGSIVNPDEYKYDVEEKVNAVLDLFYPDTDITMSDLAEKQGPGASKLDW